MYMHVYVRMHVYIHTHLCMYIYMCMCVYICMYMYIILVRSAFAATGNHVILYDLFMVEGVATPLHFFSQTYLVFFCS